MPLRRSASIKAEIKPLENEYLQAAVEFCASGFGFSEWETRQGERKDYYFNLDKAYATGASIRSFHNGLASLIQRVVDAYHEPAPDAKDPDLVLAYLCNNGGPTGAVQLRALLNERFPQWRSVMVHPDRTLLRSRLITGDEDRLEWPHTIRFIQNKMVLLIADTVTTGTSMANAMNILGLFRAVPFAGVAIFDRDEGGSDSLENYGFPVHSYIGPATIHQFHPGLAKKIPVTPPKRRYIYDLKIA